MKFVVLVVLCLLQVSLQESHRVKRDTLFGHPLGQPYFSRAEVNPYVAERDLTRIGYGSAPGYASPYAPGYAPGYVAYREPPLGTYAYLQASNSFNKLPSASPISFTRYSTVEQIDAYVDYLAERYPDLVEIATAGQSYEGRPIRVVKILPRAKPKGSRPVILVDAGIHAREWIAPAVALYMLNQLVEHNDQYRNLTEGLEWHILPLLNPDGYAYSMSEDRMWRKNRSNTSNPYCPGVDLNRNFDIFFGGQGTSADPCDETYTGTGPFSEPEARALRDYAMSLGSIRLYLTLHSYGQYFLYPWGFGDALPRDWRDLDKLGRIAQHALQEVRGTKYRVGSSTRLLGVGCGGSDDWIKSKGAKYVYTVENIGGGEHGFDLPESEMWPAIVEMWEALRTMASYVLREDRKMKKKRKKSASRSMGEGESLLDSYLKGLSSPYAERMRIE